MQFSISLAILSVLATMPAVQGHMAMTNPPPIRHPKNPNTSPGNADFNYVAPLSASGSDFPCKKYNTIASAQERTPVATFKAGSQQQITISGGANHAGGSCQVSISEDNGASFKVVHSYMGNCPVQGDSSLSFKVPSETKSGDVLLVWSWFNKVGNREMYMNCASVSITGGGSGLTDSSKFPDMFVANVGNQCTTLETTDVLFPNAGPNVDNTSTSSAPPQGSGCQSSSGPAPPAPAPVQSPPSQQSSPPAQQSSPPAQETPPPAQQTPPAAQPTTTQPTPQQPSEYPKTPGNDTKPVNNGDACTEGEIICDSPTTFSTCTDGVPVKMGNTAPGTTCENGTISRRGVAPGGRYVKFRA